jgi:RNase P subunit RPR2
MIENKEHEKIQKHLQTWQCQNCGCQYYNNSRRSRNVHNGSISVHVDCRDCMQKETVIIEL